MFFSSGMLFHSKLNGFSSPAAHLYCDDRQSAIVSLVDQVCATMSKLRPLTFSSGRAVEMELTQFVGLSGSQCCCRRH